MNDTQWGENAEAPKKRRFPKWAYFCGAGCLLALLAGVGLSIFVGTRVKDWKSAEAQLPALAEILPYDPLPPEMQFFMAAHVLVDIFIFQDTRGYVVTFTATSAGQGDEVRDQVLNPKIGGFGGGRRHDVADAQVVVQGREVRGIRCIQEMGSSFASDARAGASILLDVSPDGGTHTVIVQIMRSGGEEPVTDEEIRTLLEPFHVGPDR